MKRFWKFFLLVGLIMAYSVPVLAVDVKFSGAYYAQGWYINNHELQDDNDSNAFINQRLRIGLFDVGYQQSSSPFGTGFLDSDESVGRIKYTLPVCFGPCTIVLSYEKLKEDTPDNNRDADNSAYSVAGIWKLQKGETGIIYKYLDIADSRPAGVKTSLHVLSPYVKTVVGPVNVEAEAYYIDGKAMAIEASLAGPGVDAESYGGYVKVELPQAPASFGAILAYMKGDNQGTTDKMEGGFMSYLHWGENFNPCLILWNYDYNHDWVGPLAGNATTNPTSGYMDNVLFAQLYAGLNLNPKTKLKASLAYAKADKKPLGFVDVEYGTELDITASYKIYNNLEYMIGAAYLWAGDYFKGTNPNYHIDDNYLLMHKLTLTF
ncbi:MAG: hypothetical protein WC560_10235 [Syntrophales bacterium]